MGIMNSDADCRTECFSVTGFEEDLLAEPNLMLVDCGSAVR